MIIELEKWCLEFIKSRKFEKDEDYDIYEYVFPEWDEIKLQITPIEQLNLVMHIFENENFNETYMHWFQDCFCYIFSSNKDDLEILLQYFFDNISVMYPHASKWYSSFLLAFVEQFNYTNTIIEVIGKTDISIITMLKDVLNYIYEVELPDSKDIGHFDYPKTEADINSINYIVSNRLLERNKGNI
jgi:hypothetical protein